MYPFQNMFFCTLAITRSSHCIQGLVVKGTLKLMKKVPQLPSACSVNKKVRQKEGERTDYRPCFWDINLVQDELAGRIKNKTRFLELQANAHGRDHPSFLMAVWYSRYCQNVVTNITLQSITCFILSSGLCRQDWLQYLMMSLKAGVQVSFWTHIHGQLPRLTQLHMGTWAFETSQHWLDMALAISVLYAA